jgi:hypothetical protein
VLNIIAALEKHGVGVIDRLQHLAGIVDSPTDFALPDWAMLYSLALEFAPDQIIEVGRGYGNSTCCFLQAAQSLHCGVLSINNSDDGWRRTLPKLQASEPEQWLAPLQLITSDVLKLEPSQVIPPGARRPLFFWDAHGDDVAHYMLERIFPVLEGTDCIVVVHDVSDSRDGLLGT